MPYHYHDEGADSETNSAQEVGAPSLTVSSSRVGGHEPPHLPPSRRPLRLDLHRSLHTRRVVPKTGPHPVFRSTYQSPLHRIPVHVPQLLHRLLFVVHTEVEVAPLPELRLTGPLQLP